MKQIFFLFITIVLSIHLFVSCGKKVDSDSEVVTIRFWHSFVSSILPALEDLIRRFEAQHPAIKINAHGFWHERRYRN